MGRPVLHTVVVARGHDHQEGGDPQEDSYDWFIRTFAQLWTKTENMLNHYYIFDGQYASGVYKAKWLQEATGMIVPLSQCPSDLNDEMKWYVILR